MCFNWNFRMCAGAKLWINSPSLQQTICKHYDNNYKNSLMMACVVSQNMLENWQCVKYTFSAYKVGLPTNGQKMYKNLVAWQVIWSPKKGTLAFSGTLLWAVVHDNRARFISSCCCNIWTPTSYIQQHTPFNRRYGLCSISVDAVYHFLRHR